MKTINSEIAITEEELENLSYNFQPKLTEKLDLINTDFNQEIINQIVLWKVNRYSEIDEETFSLLNKVKKNEEQIDEELTKEILEKLLKTKGIQLAMASTILRFKNPKVYQIIDQRVYRFINGQNMPNYFNSIESQITLYLEYLRKLKNVCEQKNINFQISDRIIYELDRKHNKELKIRY